MVDSGHVTDLSTHPSKFDTVKMRTMSASVSESTSFTYMCRPHSESEQEVGGHTEGG